MKESSSESFGWRKHLYHFDVDKYLNVVIPRPRFYVLPRPVSHFFGYRPPSARPQPPVIQPVLWLSAFVGGFIGIAIISAVYHALPLLNGHQVPIVIASFGAAAILEYNTIESPLAQPRNLIVGHLLSAFIGVAITKLFQHLPEQQFEELRWLAGALSVGVASLVMSVTKTIHPPAGATALLSSTSPEITVLSWWLLPLILLASVLMTASALIVNNLTRRWPLYWWTPMDLSEKSSKSNLVAKAKDVENNPEIQSIESEDSLSKFNKSRHVEDIGARSGSEITVDRDLEENGDSMQDMSQTEAIFITRDKVVLPDWMEVDEWAMEILEIFRQKLLQNPNNEKARNGVKLSS